MNEEKQINEVWQKLVDAQRARDQAEAERQAAEIKRLQREKREHKGKDDG